MIEEARIFWSSDGDKGGTDHPAPNPKEPDKPALLKHLSNHTEMTMKTVILTTSLIASLLVGALSANAADRKPVFDGAAFFAENASRNGQ